MTYSSQAVPMMLRKQLMDRGEYDYGPFGLPGYVNGGVVLGAGKKLKGVKCVGKAQEGPSGKKRCKKYAPGRECDGPAEFGPSGRTRCMKYKAKGGVVLGGVPSGGLVLGGIPVGGVSAKNRQRVYAKRKPSAWQAEVKAVKAANPDWTMIQASQYASAVRKGLV